MTDNPAPLAFLGVKFIQDIEKIAAERGYTDTLKTFNEILAVYSTVITNLPCREEDLLGHLETALEGHVMATSLLPFERDALTERLTESVRLYLMAQNAAENGGSMAVIDDFTENPQIEFCFMPGSLVEIRDDAREAREKKAKFKRDLFASVANANAASAPAPEPAPAS